MADYDDLKASLDAKVEELRTLGELLSSEGHEPTAEEAERFDALEKEIGSLSEKLESVKQRMESESKRAEYLNRMEHVADLHAKIREFQFRVPNDNGLYRRADMNDDLNASIACWTRLAVGGPDPSEQEVLAARRLGVNPAADKFKVSDPLVRRAYARHLKSFYDDLNRRKLTSAKVEVEEEFLASAETDALDSRVPDRAGYLNRMPEMLATLETNMVSYGGILQAPVTIMVTPHFELVEEVFGDDESRRGRQIGESSVIGTTRNPKFGKITWTAYDYTSDDVLVNNRQLERSRYNLPSYIAVLLGERLGRALSEAFTNGSGASQPTGVVTAVRNAAATVQTASSLAFDYPDLVNLETGVLDPLYWGYGSGIAFAANPRMLALLRLLATGIGEAKLEIGREETTGRNTIFEKPIYWINEMQGPAPGTNALTANHLIMLYGDFSKFVIRRAGGGALSLERGVDLIVDETTNRRTRQTIFTAILSVDSQLRNYGTPPIGGLVVKP